MEQYRRGNELVQLINRKKFFKLVEKWGMDKNVRTFPTWEQVRILVYCYLMEIDSAREVELVFGVPRSTFCDANQERCAGFFEELCRHVLWNIYAQVKCRKTRRGLKNILAIDSTECSAHGALGGFRLFGAKSNPKKASVKLHVVWDIFGEWIDDFRITPGRVNDSPVSKQLVLQKGKIYVFDRAYNDHKFWEKIVASKSDFVTRLKKCARRKYRHMDVLPGKEHVTGVIWEGTWKPSRENLPFKIRHIIYRCPDTKNIFDFITSSQKLSADQVATVYKKRWAVELLFRWLKGHLNIRYFSARNPNAVKVHVAMAVLVQLLVQLDRMIRKAPGTLWEHLCRLRTRLRVEGLKNQGPAAYRNRRTANRSLLWC